MIVKTCKNCGKTFAAKSDHYLYCDECRAKLSKIYYEKHKNKLKAYAKKHYEKLKKAACNNDK